MCREPGHVPHAKNVKAVLFVTLLIPESAKTDDNFNYCMQSYNSLCNETALSTEQLDKRNHKYSAEMLKTCQISVALCNKDVLLPT